MSDGLCEDLFEVGLAGEIAGHALHLRIVEQRRIGLVAQQRPDPVGLVADQRVGRHMRDFRRNAEPARDRLVDRVPGEADIAGDVKILEEGVLLAEQPDERFCEILGPRQRPDRGAVAGDEHGLARQHAIAHRVAVIEHGGQAGARGVAGAHIGPGQVFRRLHQLFAGDLGLRIGPVRVHRGGRLGGHVGERVLLVDRCRRDEDILPGAPGKNLDVALHLLGGEHHELRDDVPFGAAELGIALGVRHVPDDRDRPLGQRLVDAGRG